MCRGLLNFGVGPQFYYIRGPHGYLKKKLSSNPAIPYPSHKGVLGMGAIILSKQNKK